MNNRREFVAGAVAAVAVPYILKKTARAQTLRMRRDVQSLDPSDPWFAKYGQAVQAMHQLQPSDQRRWRNQALIHINFCPHGAEDFVHWHRHFINNFELICGQLIGDPTFALTYWNWSAKNGIIPDPFYDLNLLNVAFWNDDSNAQSDNWGPDPVTTIGTRGLAKGQGLQDDPTAGQDFVQTFIDSIESQTSFEIFWGMLETSPHNNAHMISGGSNGHMLSGMSPLDPIFWLHHCNVDRIWAEWQTPGNTTPDPGRNYDNQFVGATGQPVMASSATALDFAAMGYAYDTISGPAVATAAARLNLQPGGIAGAPTVPQVIGRVDAAKSVVPGVEAKIPVEARDLASYLFRARTFRATKVPTVQRNAQEGGRVLARLAHVTPPQRETPLICKVFVDCPYLSPNTPSTDPHYAQSFSFFGRHRHDERGDGGFYIDLTRPLRNLFGQGRVSADKINVQLMAVEASTDAPIEFRVGKIEIVAT